MTPETKHSPLPWSSSYLADELCPEFIITDRDGVALISSFELDDYATDEANAAHIVKCVNAHDDLVAALKKCQTFITAMDGLYGMNFQVTGWHLNGAEEPLDNFFDENGFIEAREALKKAGLL